MGSKLYMILIILFGSLSCVTATDTAAINESRINPDAKIQLKGGQAYQNYYLQGEKNNGASFEIYLDPTEHYILNEVKFVDLTGDGESELCAGLQFANNIVSDFNAIYVYDTLSLKQLFPTGEGVYNSHIIPINDKIFPQYGLDYQDYAKVQSVGIHSEHSVKAWLNGKFQIMEYKEKLLADNDHIGVYLNGYSPFQKESNIKLTVYEFQDYDEAPPGEFFKKIQDINVNIKDATESPYEVINKIENGAFVKLEDKNNDGLEDIVIQLNTFFNKAENMVYYWDNSQNLFQQIY